MGLSVSGLGFRLKRLEVLGGLECRALWFGEFLYKT